MIANSSLGLPTQFDPNDGTSAGPAFVPTDIDPNNQTRSDARRTYYDPYVGAPGSSIFYLCFSSFSCCVSFSPMSVNLTYISD